MGWTRNANRDLHLGFGALWAAIMFVGVMAYWPGLGGPFLFDDFGSLSKLGDLGGVRDWETFKAFVFGGTAGPTGRPIPLLTFLIDARDWPAESWPFKRTNLVIHLANGILIAIIAMQLLKALAYERRQRLAIATVVAAMWILHPFLVSTTLYAVQRMAQLATLFVLLGLVGYLFGRAQLQRNQARAYLIMSVSLGLCTVLAVLSKENGILLPLLAGVVELTIFAAPRAAAPRLSRLWVVLFIALPTLIIAGYLVRFVLIKDFFNIVPPRDFSLFERLLTQPRVLADYLYHWFIPKLYTTGVFQDHWVKSSGLLSPVSTLLAWVLHGALITLAFVKRRQWPLLSFAILFYFGGHVIESTVLNLELYFEHRNYLPAAFLFLPLVAVLHTRMNTRMFAIVSVAVIAMLGGFTRYSATVWQDYDIMVEATARKAPTSSRAQARYAANLFNSGYQDASIAVLDRAIERYPDPLLLVNRLVLLCHMKRLEKAEFERVGALLGQTWYDPRMINVYRELTKAVVSDTCAVPILQLRQVFESMLGKSGNNDPDSIGFAQLKYFVGYALAYEGNSAAALAAFEESLVTRPGASTAMAMAALMATNGHFEGALSLADQALKSLDGEDAAALSGAKVSRDDVLRFQAVVRADLAAQQGTGTGNADE